MRILGRSKGRHGFGSGMARVEKRVSPLRCSRWGREQLRSKWRFFWVGWVRTGNGNGNSNSNGNGNSNSNGERKKQKAKYGDPSLRSRMTTFWGELGWTTF